MRSVRAAAGGAQWCVPMAIAIAPWYVTWSCGHRALLEETLPKCQWPRERVLVVDYSCPDNAGDWVEAAQLGTVLRVEAHRLTDDTPVVSRARALNAVLAHLEPSDHVLIGDPQLYPTEATRAVVCSGEVLIEASERRELIGVIAAPLADLIRVRGYLPAYVGHGAEGIDLRARLRRHGVTVTPRSLSLGVATGQAVRIWGSAALLEGRLGLMAGALTAANFRGLMM